MKKITIPIIFLISLSIMSFVITTIAKNTLLSFEDATKLGEEKYLRFLWIVDGAFNSERNNEDFIVNGKKLNKEEILFTCKYKDKKSKECVGNNFKEEFKKIFSKEISYNDVYSDGITYSWYSYQDDKHIFNNSFSCDFKRMSIEHSLKVIKISKDKIIYEVSFDNNRYVKDFILINEDDEWKISKAFYHDLCELRYNIE